VLYRIILAACIGGLSLAACAQEPPRSDQAPADFSKTDQPKVKVNILNVCTPSAEDQKEIAAALARIPRQPLFTEDFEVSRGRTTLTDKAGFIEAGQSARLSAEPATALWVRVRREFSVQAMFSTVQYSFSVDPQLMVETLVLRVRDPKDLLQISIEDNASSVTSAASMLGIDTPPSRIKLERFGKSSVVLARCPGDPTSGQPALDQSPYDPLFRSGATLLSAYRGWLGARHIVPEELARMQHANTAAKPKFGTKAAAKKPSSE
jgi:hypothetical protein